MYQRVAWVLSAVVAAAAGTTVSITDVGGVGDGVTSNTVAFVRAVEQLREAGGGTLLVPSPSSSPSTSSAPSTAAFLTGPFNLSSHITLRVEGGATILGSTNLTEWPLMPPMPSYGQGRDHPGPRHVSLIHGFNLTNITVSCLLPSLLACLLPFCLACCLLFCAASHTQSPMLLCSGVTLHVCGTPHLQTLMRAS